MFTGIVTDLGEVLDIFWRGTSQSVRIKTQYASDSIQMGESVSCNGCCLTVIDKGKSWFLVEASEETLQCTLMRRWQVGERVNLERALRMGDGLDGHLVTGHIDGVGNVLTRRQGQGPSDLLLELSCPESLAPLIAPKGSIAMNGVSLTVNTCSKRAFCVNIIAHTAAVTNLGSLKEGDDVQLEADLLARYVARLLWQSLHSLQVLS